MVDRIPIKRKCEYCWGEGKLDLFGWLKVYNQRGMEEGEVQYTIGEIAHNGECTCLVCEGKGYFEE